MMAKSVLAADALEIPQLRINQSAQEINTTPAKPSGSELSDATAPTQENRNEVPSPTGGYGCIIGDRSGNYQGNRPLSRYEFAAGINACNNQINRLFNTTTSNFATKQDLDVIKRQLERDKLELENLRNRVDRLDPQNK